MVSFFRLRADVLSILNENGSSWHGLAGLIFEDFDRGILCIRMKDPGFTDLCKRSKSGSIYESGKIFPSLNQALKEPYIKDQRKINPTPTFAPYLHEKVILHDIVLLTLL